MLAPLILSIAFSAPALAEPSPAVAACIGQAARHHQVDADLLMAIAAVESGFNPRATNTNANGSVDRGLMQINDWWIPRLAKFGISTNDLFDPCVSAYVGAWILSQEIARHGPVWRAVGAYNARSADKQVVYAGKVRAQLERREHSAVAVARPQ